MLNHIKKLYLAFYKMRTYKMRINLSPLWVMKKYGSSKVIRGETTFLILSGDGRQESERSVFSKLYQINTKPVQFHIYMNFLYALETPFGMLECWVSRVLSPSSKTHVALASTHKVTHTQWILIKTCTYSLIINYGLYMWGHSYSKNLPLGPHILLNNVHDSTLLSSSLLSYPNILKQSGLLIMLT